ncbi:hypothetical protein MSSAC_2855 [Methanosarcina siciliae C2J]|uniref:Uncharacterized protein n=1 Tax=Methanosarcina siciliae C2J TaxID=1434118 RepID=A0A0E3PP31_9EURY|nr:hypothetical protein [Methanosarcina siciliae]AKB37445.1 hypothetical protein MSSAC_2855 [Methanosarcina siciliae C2J]
MPVETGRAQLELQLDPKVIENAINRFFICEKALCINNVCVEWTVQNLNFPEPSEDSGTDSLYLCFGIGLGGAHTGENILLRLFLDGEHNEEVKLEFIKAGSMDELMKELMGESADEPEEETEEESTGLLDWEMFWEFNMVLAYLKHLKPVIYRLPVENNLFGNVYRYYVKVTDAGHALFALTTDVYPSASEFAENNHGIIEGNIAAHNRFAVAVDQEYLKDRILDAFSAVEEIELENISFSPLSRRNIEFSENCLKVTGGVSYTGSCGLVSVDIDLDYEIKATFRISGGVLDIQLDIDLDYANYVEEGQAEICGVLSMLFDSIPLPMALLMTPMVTLLCTPIAAALSDSVLDDMVARKINLDNWHEPGLKMWRAGDKTWRIRVTPVEALGLYGGLGWPLRLVEISLDSEGRVVLYGDQDAEPEEKGDQEASVSGNLVEELLGALAFEIDQMEVSTGFDSKVFHLKKEDNALVAICGWKIVDDNNHCFSVVDYPALPLEDAVPEDVELPTLKGSKLVSPQNTVPVTVTFGPHFARLTGGLDGEPALWAPLHPACGEEFSARLQVNYKIWGTNGAWENHQQYFDLKGKITSSLSMSLKDPMRFDPWVELYTPDDMFQAAAEFELFPDFWKDLPGPNDLDLLCVSAIDPAVEQLQVFDEKGNILAFATGSQTKSLTLSGNASSSYDIKAVPVKGIGEPHFFVKRDVLLYEAELAFDSPVSKLVFSGHTLAIANGKNVDFYDVHELQTPVFMGRTVFDSRVRTLHTVTVKGQRLFTAEDSKLLRTFNVPQKANETPGVVQEESTISTFEPKPLEKSVLTDKWLITTATSELPGTSGTPETCEISLFSRKEEGFELVSRLPDMPACDSVRLNGTRLFLHATNGESLELSLKDPSRPKELVHYFGACAERQLLLKSRRAFAIESDGNHVRLYSRTVRRIEHEFTMKQSRKRWEEARKITVIPAKSRPDDKRFLANSNSREVHDLNNEKAQCQIDKIIRNGHALVFAKDTLAQAHWEGYDNCAFCLGKSLR